METNDFLLYNEVVYRLHACQSMEAFKPTLLSQVKLLIPYAYGTFIPIHTDPETQQAAHGEPYCLPRSFTPMEEKWLQMADRGYSLWMSYAPEPTVTRDSELLAGDSRFDTPSYRHIYQEWRVYDCLQMTIALAGRTMGRLAFYRTRAEGAFTDQDVFALRALANHIGLACARCLQGEGAGSAKRPLAELIEAYGLTRREGEILGLILRDQNNEEILARLTISRNTLLKHLQNLYRKCGVSSRWDLRKLGG